MDPRLDRLLCGIDLERSSILEIGPLGNPAVRGRNVKYLDYADREVLAAKSAHDPAVDTSKIPHIDYVASRLADYQAIEDRFDYIIASHVIEHTPDWLGWLEVLFGLLRPDGRVVLAVPDRRYTFDYLRKESTLGESLDAYFERRQRLSFAQVFDAGNYARRIDAGLAWSGRIDATQRIFSVEQALGLAKQSRIEHVDMHAWVFTFESFMDIVTSVNELGVMAINVVSATSPVRYSNEFFVTLAR